MNRIRFLIVPAIFLVAITAILLFSTIPELQRMASLQHALITEQDLLDRQYQRSRIHHENRHALTEQQDAFEDLRNRTPQERDVLRVVQDIETITTELHVEERISMDWQHAERRATAITVPTAFEFVGTYPNLLTAMRRLEQLPLPPVIQTFSFSARDPVTSSSGTGNRIRLVMNGTTTWRMDERLPSAPL